jgi:Tfx family DNA-binding protein
MKVNVGESLLTDRQKEILRYRKSGMTQQQIADLIHTSKANVCTIEKSARDNILRAKETLKFFHTMDAFPLCILKEGSDLFDSATMIAEEAAKTGTTISIDTMDLINRLRNEFPTRIHGRFIKADIEVFLESSGGLVFG